MPKHALLVAAAIAGLALVLPAGAAAATVSSSNWAGYAASRPGVRYQRVSATWVQPATSCTGGRRTASAYWVGIGGYHTSSRALEQVGTAADCSANGTASYSAWYELVPAASVPTRMTIGAGDTISASVTVTGHVVRIFIADRTRGAVFTRRLHADRVDATSAEWIVEAPSVCGGRGGCSLQPLANFGTAAFADARATSAAGHAGPIADPTWAATPIALASDAGRPGPVRFTSDAGPSAATPAALAATGDAFTVTYQDSAAQAPAPDGQSPPGAAPAG
ncbi:MAG: hypothetical protein QOI62_1000 [Solirubrobacteraceae bacterium]|jgi:hypothetical protein|nr:hypothetical protein [Solirubrobacteraceae bacterium]